MKLEMEPVTSDEWLIRLVFHDCFKPPGLPISVRAFEPRSGRSPDTNGISLYREACLSDVLITLNPVPDEKRPQYGLVRLPVSLFEELSLSIQPDPTDVPGHVIIPQINITDYMDKTIKTLIKPKLLELARIASENIIRRPVG
jgi:hypothetical protein